MPFLAASFRPVARPIPVKGIQSRPIHFKGELIDEVDQENRKKMDLIDEFARTEPLTEKQEYAYNDYRRDYRELNDDLQHGVDKKDVTSLMQMCIGQMWQKVPDEYKQLFAQFRQSQSENPQLPRRYSSPRLSRVQSSLPETINEE